MAGERATEGLSELSGVVYGVGVHGLLPPAFRAYLLSRQRRSAAPTQSLEMTYRRVERLPAVEEIWESEPGGSETPGRLALSRLPEGWGLTVCGEERGYMRTTAERIGVEWSSAASGAAHHLFAYALPLWLESRGIPVLHGSAVTFGDRAVGLLGASGVGKSLLCAELVAAGCGFVADDGLALEQGGDGLWRCLHGPPLLRLWPSGLTGRLGIAPEPLPRVWEAGEKRRLSPEHLSGAGTAPPPGLHRRPLAAVYVLHRRRSAGGGIRISPSAPRRALAHLLEHGVAAAPAAALGLAGGRLERLGDVAGRVPVRRLTYPTGGSAQRLREVIARDLEGY